MKTLLSAILMTLALPSMAGCLVELQGVNVAPFIENSCRDALRECNKFKRTNNYSYARCETIDENYGSSYPPGGGSNYPGTGNGYPGNGNGYPGSGNGYPGQSGNVYDRINSMDIVDQVEKQLYQNLYLIKNVDGWSTQVYVNGQFSGNYRQSDYYKMEELRARLQRLTRGYQHPLKPVQELRRLLNVYNTHNIIQEFVSATYRNCHVKPYVDGWAHQVYINGRFQGNFRINNSQERNNLENTLRRYLANGTCYR